MKIKFGILLMSGLVVSWLHSFPQKAQLDSTSYKFWTSLDWGNKISNDANYTLYSIGNQPAGSSTLIISNLKKSKEYQIPNVSAANADFTQNSKMLIFLDKENRLGLTNLTTFNTKYISNVSSYTLPEEGDGKWLIYNKKTPENTIVIKNLFTDEDKTIQNVKNYNLNKSGNLLALHIIKEKDSSELKILHLHNGSTQMVWNGLNLKNLLFDASGEKLAFLTGDSQKNDQHIIWYFNLVMQKMVRIEAVNLDNLEDSLYIDDLKSFTTDEKGILLTLRNKSTAPLRLKQTLPLILWSYTDTKLQSEKLKDPESRRSYSAYISLEKRQLIRLEEENDEIEAIANNNKIGVIALVSKTDKDVGRGESNWNTAARRNWQLIFTENNKKTAINELANFPGGTINFSPNGKFLVFYNPDKMNYFSYEISSGLIRNITKTIHTSWLDNNRDDLPLSKWNSRGIGGWITKTHSVLIYDKNDIWQIDLKGTKAPVNLTNGFGSRKKIKFNLETEDKNKEYSNTSKLLLNAFNQSTKENGFYQIDVGHPGDPEVLFMGPYIFNLLASAYLPSDSRFRSLKAKDKKVFLVRRMSEKESPNLFTTQDFRNFSPISCIYPEKHYNFLTTELHSWESLDGRQLLGVLYKPENFDPNKRYPIIFHYYERKSDGLHYYIKPEDLTSGCAINIPTYVSNGYLVFSPDIYYKVGDPMQGTYDAVVSAAKYISKLPFVDSTKMGIQGCSFGGIQTDYLVTHTNLFSAAVSASGIADFIASSGYLSHDGSSKRGDFEIGQIRMGYSLWERPDLYIKNSAIFNVDKVTTPLLIMHTTKDGACSIIDAREFFAALRRLGKISWLLEYEDGDHGVWGKSGIDFSIRMKQFFDYYLKNSLPPKWMVQGIEAKERGLENSLDLLPNSTKLQNGLSVP